MCLHCKHSFKTGPDSLPTSFPLLKLSYEEISRAGTACFPGLCCSCPLKGPKTAMCICLFEDVLPSSSITLITLLKLILMIESYAGGHLGVTFFSFLLFILTWPLKMSSWKPEVSMTLFCSAYPKETLNFFLVSPLTAVRSAVVCGLEAEEDISLCVSSETVLVSSWPFLVLEQVWKLSFHFISFHFFGTMGLRWPYRFVVRINEIIYKTL